MQRVTITLDDDLLEAIDALTSAQGYGSRSEALRDIVRNAFASASPRGTGPSIAALTYVYDHETRELARRLTNVQHEHHHLSVSSLHVHLDHDTCLEVSVMKGDAAEIERVAAAITSQRGVRYANLHLIPSSAPAASHDHGHQHEKSKR